MDRRISHLDWIDGLKAFAIIGILWNHVVEATGSMPWFSNPSDKWPSFAERMQHVFPEGENLFVIIMKFIGWLGDMGPGVFLLASGFTLTFSLLNKEQSFNTLHFYKRRLLRIFPLYLTIHVVFIILLILRDEAGGLNSERVALSLLGLRLTDSLFFFINPSWWFIWLILQLYFVFPWLFKLLRFHGGVFITGTLLFTLLSRMAGIMDFHYNNSLFNWMTGLFFGTRLFEFTAGMYLAYLYHKKGVLFFPGPFKMLLVGFAFYMSGFVLSWFYIGSLFSNIFITLGLSGLFYGFYKYMAGRPGINKITRFIGLASFPAFLIHQPFMIWVFSDTGSLTLKVIISVLIALFSLPVGYFLEKGVNQVFEVLKTFFTSISMRYRMLDYFMISVISLHFINNIAISFIEYGMVFKVFILFSLGLLVGIPVFVLLGKLRDYRFKSFLFNYFFLTLLFITLPDQWMSLFWVSVIAFVIVMFLLSFAVKRWMQLSIISLSCFIILFSGLEIAFRKSKPLEAGRWGEYPALQVDSLTIYSLIPSKTTHLRYNNYNYYVRTNTMGFNSPEINLAEKQDHAFRVFIMGDAFTMPEGFQYENAYPFILDRMLTERFPERKIEIINAGVTGYGPNEWERQLKKYNHLVKPDLVINQFFINEYEEIKLTPEERLKDIGLVNDYSFFQTLFFHAQIPAWYKKILNSFNETSEKSYNYYKSHAFLYDRQQLDSYYNSQVISKMESFFKSIKMMSGSSGAKICLLFVPGQLAVAGKNEIDHYPVHVDLEDTSRFDLRLPDRITGRLCKEQGIEFLNTRVAFDTCQSGPFYFNESWHWNKSGHAVAANMLFQYIINDSILIK
ncbi:MAG: acyltransferase family protein [Bacteroidota bacterium]